MRQLEDIVRTYRSWGIAGIKLGFVWEGRQEDADFLQAFIRKCGENRLFVLLHDNLRPAGLERTLPNYLTLEGVRGNEHFPTARHNATIYADSAPAVTESTTRVAIRGVAVDADTRLRVELAAHGGQAIRFDRVLK